MHSRVGPHDEALPLRTSSRGLDPPGPRCRYLWDERTGRDDLTGSFASNFILVNNRTRVLLLRCICFPRTLNVQFVRCTCSSHHWSSSCGIRPWLSGTLHEGAVAGVGGRPGSHSETLGGRGGWPCHPPGKYEDGGGGVICFFLRGRSEFVQRFSCVTPETCAMPRIAYHCGRIGPRRPSHRMMDIFRQRTGFSIQSDLRSHTAEITASARGQLPSHTGPSPETGVPEPPPMRTLSPCGRCPHPSQLWRGQGTGSRGSRVILQTSVPHKNRKHT